MMPHLRNAAAALLALSCFHVSVLPAQATPQPRMVDVGDHRLNVRIAGAARPGVPIVVFESGLGSPVEVWSRVQAAIAESTMTVAYDRAGIGRSEPGKETPTFKHIVSELHTLLGKLDTPPPYVLVGHSWGGPIIHAFATTFPKEVAALVYVDPTDFTQTEADMLALWNEAGVKDGHAAMAKMMEQMPPGVPPGILAEAREAARVQESGFAELRAAGDAPDVPMFILLGGKRAPLPPGNAFPGDYERYFEAGMEQRVDHFSRLVQRAAQGTLLLTSKSGHFIQASEPDLVVWAIRRALASAMAALQLGNAPG
jgi:pimeloyl-ACP methyl ester carboxylesterase